MRYSKWLLGFVGFFWLGGLAQAGLVCLEKIAGNPEVQWARDFRAKVVRANHKQALSKHKISLLTGNEHRHLLVSNSPNAHVLYLCSGGDVYRFLRDFPLADNFHFLDIWTKWGDSPLYAIFSIKQRIESVADSVQVVSLGFLEDFSFVPSDFARFKGMEWLDKSEQVSAQPIILEAMFGAHKKRFYLHRFDMANSDHVDRVLDSIPQDEPFVGILQAGLTGTPHAHDLTKFLDRLEEGTWYLKEFGGPEYLENDDFRLLEDDVAQQLPELGVELKFLPPYQAKTAMKALVVGFRRAFSDSVPTKNSP